MLWALLSFGVVFFARDMGLVSKAEIYADRGYDETGFLIARSLPGALLKDPQQAADRILRMLAAGGVETSEGRTVATPIDSICVHSDTPGAIEMAARVRALLEGAGVTVQAFA